MVPTRKYIWFWNVFFTLLMSGIYCTFLQFCLIGILANLISKVSGANKQWLVMINIREPTRRERAGYVNYILHKKSGMVIWSLESQAQMPTDVINFHTSKWPRKIGPDKIQVRWKLCHCTLRPANKPIYFSRAVNFVMQILFLYCIANSFILPQNNLICMFVWNQICVILLVW